MKVQINFIFKNQIYNSLNVIFLEENLIQIKEIPFDLIGIRYNDIIEISKQNEEYVYLRKFKKSNCKRSSFLLASKMTGSEELREFLDTVVNFGGDWEISFGNYITLEIPKETFIDAETEIDKIFKTIEKNPKYQTKDNFLNIFLNPIEFPFEKKIQKSVTKIGDDYLIKLSGEIGEYNSIFNSIGSLVELYQIEKIIIDISEISDFYSSSQIAQVISLISNLKKIGSTLKIRILDNKKLFNYFKTFDLIEFFEIEN